MQRPIRIMTVAPGHFHAALVHKQMLPGIHPRVHIYGPLDGDTLTHIDRLRLFNSRTENPTSWDVNLCAGEQYLDRLKQQAPGNVVVLAGRNCNKIELALAAAKQNLDLLIDKPWIIRAEDFPKLLELYQEVDLRDLVIWDMMTERFEPFTQIQRALIRDQEIFGAPLVGNRDHPTLTLESVHYLKKSVAGQALRRPIWWFNRAVAGHAITDVGTHLADLAMWLLFPDTALDYQRDIQILNATAWPTMLDEQQFETLTSVKAYPAELAPFVQSGTLHYPGNGCIEFTLRGAHIRLTTLWDYESQQDSGDFHEATVAGSHSRLTVRNSSSQKELTISVNDSKRRTAVFTALSRRCQSWQSHYPGLSVHDRGKDFELRLPSALQSDHESHFQSVLKEFAGYFHNSRRMPAWERPNLLAKYWLTTQAELLLRKS